MQKEKHFFSPIKQRILQFIDQLPISKREFYAKTGISRGTLESKTGITEETITKFFAAYPEVNIDWLIRGEGEMLRALPPERLEGLDEEFSGRQVYEKVNQDLKEMIMTGEIFPATIVKDYIQAKNELIEQLKKENQKLEDQLNQLKRRLEI